MSEWQLLHIRVQMESLITQREAMKAANEHRAMQGYSQMYGEEAFLNVQTLLESLVDQLRQCGS